MKESNFCILQHLKFDSVVHVLCLLYFTLYFMHVTPDMQFDKLRSMEFGRTTDLWVFEIHLYVQMFKEIWPCSYSSEFSLVMCILFLSFKFS